jgi:DNA-binding CsgD family transcriptional regulator
VRRDGDRQLEWQTLLDLGHLWAARDYTRTGDYYRQALELAQTIGDETRVAHSLNRLGNWHINVARPQEGLRSHHAALRYFEAARDRRGLAETLDLLGMANYQIGDMNSAAEHYQRAIPLFRELDDPHGLASSLTTLVLLSGTYFNSTVVPATTPPVEVERAVAEALQIARALDAQADIAYASFNRAAWLGLRGRYAMAFADARTSLEIAQALEHRQWTASAHCVLGALHLDLLSLTEARSHLEQALELAVATNSRLWICYASGLLAGTYVAMGENGRAADTLAAALPPDASFQVVVHRMCWQARARLALVRGEHAEALQIADQLRGSAIQLHDDAAVPHLAHLRGMILAAQREAAAAAAAFQRAAQGAERLGLEPLLWRVNVAQAALLLAEQHPAEAERAAAGARAQIRALTPAIPGELRAQFVQQAEALLPLPPAPRRAAAPPSPGGLTSREVEVARLVAHGHSNRAIAERLVLSERTVESHVSNILAKCGFTSRAQVAAWATAQRLVDPEHPPEP